MINYRLHQQSDLHGLFAGYWAAGRVGHSTNYIRDCMCFPGEALQTLLRLPQFQAVHGGAAQEL